jgi:hypothetical protein
MIASLHLLTTLLIALPVGLGAAMTVLWAFSQLGQLASVLP